MINWVPRFQSVCITDFEICVSSVSQCIALCSQKCFLCISVCRCVSGFQFVVNVMCSATFLPTLVTGFVLPLFVGASPYLRPGFFSKIAVSFSVYLRNVSCVSQTFLVCICGYCQYTATESLCPLGRRGADIPVRATDLLCSSRFQQPQTTSINNSRPYKPLGTGHWVTGRRL